jgi:hypothetical protein
MTDTHLRLVRRIGRRLAAALEVREASRADRRIDRIMLAALESRENLEATFAAVQMLRDLDVVEACEAAYLFNSMLSVVEWDDEGPPSEALQELVQRLPTDVELVSAAMSHESQVAAEIFHRSRGEHGLADVIGRDMEEYHAIVAEGEMSIFDSKEDDAGPPPEARSTDARLVMERVLALSARESIRDWVQSWTPLMESIRQVTPGTAVRAIQEARGIGAISFEEHLRLMDLAIEDQVLDECRRERRYARLERKRDALHDRLGIDPGKPDAEQPAEYLMVEAETRRFYDGMTAVVLRRFGEHRLANLMIEDPAEYARIRERCNPLSPCPAP